MDKKFLRNYLNAFVELALPSSNIIKDLILVKDALIKAQDNDKKTIIVGNGGSAAIASHFSVDLTKNADIRCVNFNESSLITCFANDYGYEHWLEKAVELYGDEGDVFIALSSSGKSKNIINSCGAARKKNFSKVITFSGFDIDNPLRKIGDINLWANSKTYNLVENIHQLWLSAIMDLVKRDREYPS